MKDGAIASLLVVAILIGAGAGYFAGSNGQHTTTVTPSTTVTSTVTTTAFSTAVGPCSPLSNTSGIAIPVGFRVTISNEGNWSISIAAFAAKSANESTFYYSCYSDGIGTRTYYVGLGNYTGGQNTLQALAQKLSANGNLTLNASIGSENDSNNVAQPYGSTFVTLTFKV